MSEELKVDILLVLYANPRGVRPSDLRQAFLSHHGRPLELAPCALEEVVEEMTADIVERRMIGGRETLVARGATQAQAARPQAHLTRPQADPPRPQAHPARPQADPTRPQAPPTRLQAHPTRPQAQLGPTQQASGPPAATKPQRSEPLPPPSAWGARKTALPLSRIPGGSEQPDAQAERPLTYSQALQRSRCGGGRPPTPCRPGDPSRGQEETPGGQWIPTRVQGTFS
ncbi:hypothetical protein chiPu_0029641, partial [Chiloscyllium punctatum]|nr:hypothetical protein [Chiloscyllium punctatum]